ncbi:MAG: alpha/beta fold hydrolase [Verrucomicrobia bacterium]|nr:alpha/beta fold hydrolase [Verrucomicrobiota bacterium]
MKKLFQIDSGPVDAPVVVLLHGFMGSSADWGPTRSSLADDFRCISFDLSGHGKSVDLGADEYSMALNEELLVEELRSLDIESAALVGYSMGGRLALYMLASGMFPWTRVCVESANPGGEAGGGRGEWESGRVSFDEERARELETGDLRTFLQKWYGQSVFASLRERPDLLTEIIERLLENDPRELAKALVGMSQGKQKSLWGTLSTTDIPILAVAGALDAKYADIVGRMDGLSPTIRGSIVQGAGHVVHAEKPDEWSTFLKEFLSE